MVTSKNRFEKRKSAECVGCKESRRRKAVCLARRFDAADGSVFREADNAAIVDFLSNKVFRGDLILYNKGVQ